MSFGGLLGVWVICYDFVFLSESVSDRFLNMFLIAGKSLLVGRFQRMMVKFFSWAVVRTYFPAVQAVALSFILLVTCSTFA